MTAAHCTWGRIKIWFSSTHYGLAGCNNRQSADCHRLNFAWVWNHPLYFPPLQLVPGVGIQNDIALIKLANPFSSWPNNIRPVCLPSEMSPPWGFDKVTVAGWGVDEAQNLQTNLKYVSMSNLRYLLHVRVQTDLSGSSRRDLVTIVTNSHKLTDGFGQVSSLRPDATCQTIGVKNSYTTRWVSL